MSEPLKVGDRVRIVGVEQQRPTDTLTLVSHYYKEDHRLQGVFFYQDGRYIGPQTRLYRSTKNLQPIRECTMYNVQSTNH